MVDSLGRLRQKRSFATLSPAGTLPPRNFQQVTSVRDKADAVPWFARNTKRPESAVRPVFKRACLQTAAVALQLKSIQIVGQRHFARTPSHKPARSFRSYKLALGTTMTLPISRQQLQLSSLICLLSPRPMPSYKIKKEESKARWGDGQWKKCLEGYIRVLIKVLNDWDKYDSCVNQSRCKDRFCLIGKDKIYLEVGTDLLMNWFNRWMQ